MQEPCKSKESLSGCAGWTRRISLDGDDGAANFMERADVIGLGLSYDMLLDALYEAEGAIDVNGRYPIDDAIRRRLGRIFH